MTTRAPRFAGLQAELAKVSAATRASDANRIALIKSAARGEAVVDRLGTAKRPSAAAAQPALPVAKLTPVSVTKPAATGPAPKREPWKVPADVAAKGSSAELGYRIAFEAVSDQLARMSRIPAAQSRIGSLIEMVASGSSDADIRRDLAAMPTDRQRQISATWDRAISSVYADRSMFLNSEGDADGPEPRDAARQRMTAVANDDLFIGNEAKALTYLTKEGFYGLRAGDLLDVLAISTGSERTAEATWDRAISAVFGAAASRKSDRHGWAAIHADIRERREQYPA